MACSEWLLVLVVMLMTSSAREQSACSQLRSPDVSQEKHDSSLLSRPCRGDEGPASTRPPPGVGLLGRGFHVYRGNLLSADTDTGFRLPVVSLTYAKGLMTFDHRYLLPDSTDLLYVTTSRDKQSDDVIEVRTDTDILRMISERIQLHPTYIHDGRFMASRAYADFRSTHDTLLYEVVERPLYSVSLEGQGHKASQAFRDALLLLPISCGSDKIPAYLQLIHKYGTHVVSHVTLGKMAAQHVTLSAEQVIREKLAGHSVKDIFAKYVNMSSLSSDPAKCDTVPLGVRVEPLHHFFTSTFLGQDTIDLPAKRKCFTQAVSVYCRTLKSSICQQSFNLSTGIRYGDSISLKVGDSESIFIEDNIVAIGSGTGLRLVRGVSSSTSSLKRSLRVLPPRGQEGRLGEPLYTGDVFTLEERDTSRIQLAETSGPVPSQHSLAATPVYFRDVRQRMSLRNTWQLFIEKTKGRPHHVLVTTAAGGWGVAVAGPWSLTVETAHSVVSVVIDPCRQLCLPGGITSATILLPLVAGQGITSIHLSVVPPVLGLSTRPGNWSIQNITLTDTETMATYTTGTATLHSSCVQCPSARWSIDDGSLLFYQPNTSTTTRSLDAEFYFRFPGRPSGGAIENGASVSLQLVGYTGTTNTSSQAHALSCSEMTCHNGGQCKEGTYGAICECTAFWTGSTCQSACSAELFIIPFSANQTLLGIHGVFGSSGQPSSSTTEWLFPPKTFNDPLPYVVILLSMVAKVSGVLLPHSLQLHWLKLQYSDVSDGAWKGGAIISSMTTAGRGHSVSLRGSLGLTTDKLKFIFKGGGGAFDLNGLVIYGCTVSSRSQADLYVDKLLSGSFNIIKTESHRTYPVVLDSLQGSQLNMQQPVLVVEKLTIQVVINPLMTCDLNIKSVQWSLAQQIDLCRSHIKVTNVTLINGPDWGNYNLASIELTLSGEQAIVASTIRLVKATNFTISCQSSQKGNSDNNDDDVRNKLSSLEVRLTALSAVVIVLMILCLVVFVIAMVIMSRRYRDISNELTTLRKLKMQKRVAKRQELQPQVPTPQAFTLPRPNSTTGSTTTSIPGRLNGQTRSLRYSQSLHGHSDRPPRLEPTPPMAAAAAVNRGLLDPSNYIIANPHPVRTPSPVGTRSGEDSDTVQSIC